MSFLKNRIFLISIAAIVIIAIVVCMAFYMLKQWSISNSIPVATKIEECITQDCLQKFLNQDSAEADCLKTNPLVPNLRDNCYLILSSVSKNSVDCKKITNAQIESQCETNEAIAKLPDTLFDKKWDRSYCNSLSANDIQLITGCNRAVNDHYTSDLPIIIDAVKNNSSDKCSGIKSQKVFSLCNEIVKALSPTSESACSSSTYSEKDIGNVCQWVQNRVQIVDPIIDSAVKAENISLCETIKGKNAYYDSHECVFKVITTSLKDICGQLKNSDLKNNCYVTLALQKKDASYCKNAADLQKACESLVK